MGLLLLIRRVWWYPPLPSPTAYSLPYRLHRQRADHSVLPYRCPRPAVLSPLSTLTVPFPLTFSSVPPSHTRPMALGLREQINRTTQMAQKRPKAWVQHQDPWRGVACVGIECTFQTNSRAPLQGPCILGSSWTNLSTGLSLGPGFTLYTVQGIQADQE